MKIIVCGAGSVGRSIVSYLVKGNNDIVVIDDNQRYLDEISKEFDVLPVWECPLIPIFWNAPMLPEPICF